MSEYCKNCEQMAKRITELEGMLSIQSDGGYGPIDLLSEIMHIADHQIPVYAYGDHEAACDMNMRLKEIYMTAAEYINNTAISETTSEKGES